MPQQKESVYIYKSVFLSKFLNKDAELRLGSKTCPYGDVMDQPFFQYINWDRLERRQLEPPFKPRVVNYTCKIIIYHI